MRTGWRIGLLLVALAAVVMVLLLPSSRSVGSLSRVLVAPVEALLGPFAMVGLNLIPLLFVIGVVVAVARLIGHETPGESGRAHRSLRLTRPGLPTSEASGRGLMNEEESRLIQDLHRGFSRIEELVEALETILIERHRSAR